MAGKHARDRHHVRLFNTTPIGTGPYKLVKRVATALWSSGELAIRERRNFQRIYDLAERVIPECWRQAGLSESQAIEQLLLQALKGHGWASTGTLSQTWRLTNQKKSITAALNRLVEKGEIVPCILAGDDKKKSFGWIRPNDLELAARLKRVRAPADRGVLLSPFDPVLWDRRRVRQLFSFDQILEIFKPASKRKYGYYCLPVLAGEQLVARVDLKARMAAGTLEVLSLRFEGEGRPPSTADKEAARTALARYSGALGLTLSHRV